MIDLFKISCLILIFSINGQKLFAQNYIEVYFGLNERAKSDIELADDILEKSPGFILGVKYSRIYSIKDKPYLGSAGFGFLIHKQYFSNLKYEFGRIDDGPDATEIKNLTMGFAKINFCRLFNYHKQFSKENFYFGIGAFVIFNAFSISGDSTFYDNDTNSFRQY